MKERNIYRKFELPYNFDKKLIDGYKMCGIDSELIDCIYIPPFIKDYQTILRKPSHLDVNYNLTNEEDYIDHINFIQNEYPGKLQLLLQKTNGPIMEKELILKYINLGFRNFCVGSIEQAKLIKEVDNTIKIVGSISMHIRIEQLYYNKKDYIDLFDAFVLDFSWSKNLALIKLLPSDFEYILLVNSFCNNRCNGDQHWWFNPNYKCPGIFPNKPYEDSCLVRPMDLKFFDPYIHIYKIQDRGWPTEEILRDIVLYTTNYSIYPGIIYDEKRYTVNAN